MEDRAAINQRNRPVPGRLSLITLGVSDLEKQKNFYAALGWETRSTGGDFAAFPLGGAVLSLYSLQALAGETNMPEPQLERFRGFTCAINVDREEQVDEAIEAVKLAGGQILAEPVTRDWGGRSGYFADPEGNVWEVAWLPDAEFDERGGLIWPYG